MRKIIFSLLLAISFSSPALAKNILPAPQKIAPHSYAWIGPLPGPSYENQGYRMNLGFVVGSKGIVVIDTGYTEAMAKEMLGHIRNISKAPIIAAINTNSQPHRFFGNSVFKNAGAKIISTAKEAQRMEASAGQYSSNIERTLKLKAGSISIPAMPDTIITKPTTLKLGGVSVLIESHGASHTPASLVVHVAEDKLVFSGDILYGNRLLAVIPASNVKQWIASFNKLKKYGGVKFVPGHGQIGSLKDFEFSTLNYLQLLQSHMIKSLDADMEAQDAISTLNQSAYSKLANYDLLFGRNASWAYLEAEKAAFE
ncbi:MAG: MBL fold metallo-hydrolase [Sulfuriflexus sp.]|nr:MBL fold metallo-hydrolase [Sulfuriflexus sp.]